MFQFKGPIGIGNVNTVLGGTGLACEQHTVTGGEGYPVNLRRSVLQVNIGKGGHAGSGMHARHGMQERAGH